MPYTLIWIHFSFFTNVTAAIPFPDYYTTRNEDGNQAFGSQAEFQLFWSCL